MSCPLRRRLRISSIADAMCETSGSLLRVSGVGTHTLITSQRDSSLKSTVAESFLRDTASAISAGFTSSMYDSPRWIASAGGQIVGASSLGKMKTVTQNVAVGALLFHFTTLGLDAHRIGVAFLFLATALTIASGYRYFADYFGGLAGAGR